MIKGTVVVFGGGGYVGTVLIPALLDEGYIVRVFDTFWYEKSIFNIFQTVPPRHLFFYYKNKMSQ